MATKTKKYGLTKPDANDYYDIGVFNENMDIIEEEMAGHAEKKTNPHSVTAVQVGAAKATEHYIKTYETLGRIGVTVGSETIEDVLANMPNFSVLEYVVTSAHNAEIYPFGYGKVLFRKMSNNYASMTFWKYSGTPKMFYEGHAYYTSGAWDFYGWKQIVTEDVMLEVQNIYGTYTGTGSTEERVIEIFESNHSDILLITSSEGTAIVVPSGAIILTGGTNGSMTNISDTQVEYINGTLKLWTTNSKLNASGVTYVYQVL